MNAEIVYHLPGKAPQRKLPRAYYWQRSERDKLIVAYASQNKKDTSITPMLTWATIDLHTNSVQEQEILFISDDTQSPIDVETLQLAYDEMENVWLLGILEFQSAIAEYHLVLRAIHKDRNRQIEAFHILFDDPANDMAAIGPLLMLETENGLCYMMYLKPEQDYIATTTVALAEIPLAGGQINHTVIDFAESALVCKGKDMILMLSCTPEILTGELLAKMQKEYDYSTYEWLYLLSGGKEYAEASWLHYLERGIPVDKRAVPVDDLITGQLVLSATAIAGPERPENGLPTFVASMIMMNAQHKPDEKYRITAKTNIHEQVSRLLCIDAEGNLVQTYQGSIGLYPVLCRARNHIVGVDLIGDQWRLWTWRPLEQATFDQLLLLDKEVQRACVIVEDEPGQEDVCWLIEEYADRVIISKRSAVTLEQVASPAVLSSVHLLLPQSGYGRLDWHTEVDALVHDDTMLLLAVDNDDQLVLYRVKEEPRS